MRPVDHWHALLGPLPADAVPKRQPVASPEILATAEGAAIAGWEQLVLDLSAGAAGHRIVLVVLDETGRPISASDHALFRSEADNRVEMRQESIGGRFESDGSFRGTRWLITGPEPPGRRAFSRIRMRDERNSVRACRGVPTWTP